MWRGEITPFTTSIGKKILVTPGRLENNIEVDL
jgi:hypothetical protein